MSSRKSSTPPQVAPQETAEIVKLAEKCLSCDGDFVEFGCYRGDTSVELAKILRGAQLESTKNTNSTRSENADLDNPAEAAKTSKRLWLYDSFAGLPPKTAEDQSAAGDQFQAGELPATKRALLDRFRRAGLPRPIVRKAFFDQLDPARDLPDEIAFAFLDGDLYRSIKTSLKLVWPRLSPGAIVIVHDYNNPELPGVARAVDEFLRANNPVQNNTHYTLAIIAA